MRRLLVLVVVAACGSDRMLITMHTPKTLAEVMGPGGEFWSVGSGSVSINARNTNQFPSPMTMRLSVIEQCGHDYDGEVCEFEMATASIDVVAGSPCMITIPTSCSGSTCYAELQLTGLGNCRLRVAAETVDGFDANTCWYQAAYEADDPSDPAVFAMYDAKTNAEADCE